MLHATAEAAALPVQNRPQPVEVLRGRVFEAETRLSEGNEARRDEIVTTPREARQVAVLCRTGGASPQT